MFTLIAENKYGQQLELTHNSAYDVIEIDGLDPPDAIINTTKNANTDGSVFNSSYVDDRTIIITLAVNKPAESNRINLYKYFKTKFPVRLYYRNGARNVYIDGYVKNVPVEFFGKKQTVQITVFCPDPFFNDVDDALQDFSNIESLFEFPFDVPAAGVEFSEIIPNAEQSIINNGDVETGVIISIHAIGAVVNPKIYNTETGENFSLNITLADGDDVLINTIIGQKSVSKTTNGTTTNIIGNIADGSTWLQMIPGDNLITVTADGTPENMQIAFTVKNQYEGV